MKTVFILFIIALPSITFASDRSPYAGEELRQISSLSENEIKSLRRGDGMGFAKLAELNHFPGPKHVLEIADQLNLSQSQIDASALLYQEMHDKAVLLGEKILKAESQLDQEFENESVTAQSLKDRLLEIGSVRAQLRYVHLESHLRQKLILTTDQVAKYDAIRGYGTNENGTALHPQSHRE